MANKVPSSGFFLDDSPPDIDSILKTYGPLIDNKKPIKGKANISFGSQDVDTHNHYSGSNRGETRNGPLDIQIGNIYPENPDGRNIYGPTLIQGDNTYEGNNEKAMYGPTVIRSGNVYPKNSGKGSIDEPVLIQRDNIYPNLHPVASQTHRAVEATDSQRRDNFDSPQGLYIKTEDRTKIDMAWRQFEDLKTTINDHLQIRHPTSTLCANSKEDLKELNKIGFMFRQVEPEAIPIEALKEIKRYRKMIYSSRAHRCY